MEATDIIEADPVYGAALANYPSDRGRLLLIGGGIYFGVGTVLNLAFASVDAQTASIVVISVMAVLALAVGWVILHLWNREVVLYERGFSYREGSQIAFFFYTDVRALHLRLERVAYFGGIIRRTIREMTLKTRQDETIKINSLYRRIEELCTRMEAQVNRAVRPVVDAKLEAGQTVAFGGNLSLNADGLMLGEDFMSWLDYARYSIGGGKLTLHTRSEENWRSVKLSDLDNATLLLSILQSHTL